MKFMKLYQEKRLITRESGELYMTRWYLIKNSMFNLMLHKIVLSDHECVHDHPWNFISLILKGGYVEHSEREVRNGYIKKWSKIYHPFQILYRKAEHRHRLEIHQTCWSLVLRFKVRRKWGFWTKLGWVHWKLFNEKENCG